LPYKFNIMNLPMSPLRCGNVNDFKPFPQPRRPVAAPFTPFADGASGLSGPVAVPFVPFSDGASALSRPVAAPFTPFTDGVFEHGPSAPDYKAHPGRLALTRN
jgi:hypothetical protein